MSLQIWIKGYRIVDSADVTGEFDAFFYHSNNVITQLGIE